MGLMKRRVIMVGSVVVLALIGGLMMVRGDETAAGHGAAGRGLEVLNQVPAEKRPSADEERPAAVAGGGVAAPSQLDIAAGFARSEQGARHAAVAFLELTEEAVEMSPAEAAALQRPYATADFADESAAETERSMIELLERVPAGVILRLAPLEIRSVSEGDEWVVSIWFVEAISIGRDGVVDDWRTVTYRLRWEEGSWKVAAFGSVRGPMPGRGNQPASASPSHFEALLDGFDDEGLN